ncbi:substrate-binding domain-containing protein [Nibrella saemangeumensis]|uniref:Substrate-binding domain-containing protein n=1 Tax=Nibrella saemangeumensis TaxID=1084526 RepID=A0ABP8NFX6_9BACT
MNKKVSLKDIAQRVGVSTTLVSYVLNNQKENRIRKDVAQKIRDVAQELNYRTNQIAKSLKTKKTFTLGLIVADIANPFSSSLARIIEDEADRHNYTVIFGSSDENPQKSRKLIDTLLKRQVDGLIIAPPDGAASQIADLQRHHVPFVLIDRYFPDLKTSYVALDNCAAVYAAVDHLIDRGYRRIGLVTLQSSLYHMNERKRGYLAALKDRNLTFHKHWLKEISPDILKPEIERATDDLLAGPQPVEALLFTNNTVALHGLKYLQSLRLRIPDDLAIVCFDETDALDLFYTPITHIRQPLREIGQQATRILLETIDKTNKITQVNLQAELVVRESTSQMVSKLVHGR